MNVRCDHTSGVEFLINTGCGVESMVMKVLLADEVEQVEVCKWQLTKKIPQLPQTLSVYQVRES